MWRMTSTATAPATSLLRHSLATLAYRAAKTLRGAPAEFANFRASPATRTPAEILAHMGDLMDWALSLVDGKQAWHNSTPLDWDDEVARFFRTTEVLDRRLAAAEPSACAEEKLFQGPIADALWHAGQIAMLRRMSGAPIKGENYLRANIAAGCAGANQPQAVKEFD